MYGFIRSTFDGFRRFILAAILISAVPAMFAQEGLVALYTFQEGEGATVGDVSGAGDPLNLEIEDPASVTWLQGGGISVDRGSIIASPGPATKIIEGAMASNELTVEAWVKPSNLAQSGPARAVTVSANPSNRNFTMGQNEDFWIMRTRTPVTGNNGSANNTQFNAPDGTTTLDLQHVVYTRDAGGADTMYVNGQEVAFRNDVGGDFSNWNTGYRLGLAGELDGSRFWLGEIHRVAIYSRALSAQEIADIYDQLALTLDIVDVEPPDGTVFYSASQGIRFRAVTFAGNTVSEEDIQLTLNGVDRSADLTIGGNANDREVSFTALEPDRVYEGVITIEDSEGETRSVSIDFDTYSLPANGLLALYEFNEGSGAVIRDVSEAGVPLDLTIADLSLVSWQAGGGLKIESAVPIASTILAEKIRQPVQQSGELTVEAWIWPADVQSGPARIVTASEFRQNFPGNEAENSLRNFTLAQNGSAYELFIRTSETDLAGNPPVVADSPQITLPVQAAYTQGAGGQANFYINGEAITSETVTGDFSNWFEGFRLGLAGELNDVISGGNNLGRRSWLGSFYRVAIYNRALTGQEVADSFGEFFVAGDTTPPSVPQNLAAQAGAAFVALSWDASDDDSGRPAFYEVEQNGTVIATFVEGTEYIDQAVSENSAYTYRVRSIDISGNTSDFSGSADASTGTLSEVTGLVRADFYTDIGAGVTIFDLLEAPSYPDSPNRTMFLPALETPLDWGNNYGVRVTGWFVPPETGEYVFFIASDDQGEFYLSTDDDPANVKLVAYEAEWNPHRDWTGLTRRDVLFGPENRSDRFFNTQWPDLDPFGALIGLQQGQEYFFEALMKEGGGGDHLSVTYILRGEEDPANGSPSRMRGDVIKTVGDPDFVPPAIVVSPESRAVALGDSVTLGVELAEFSSAPFSYQWRFEGGDIQGAVEADYTIDSFQESDAGAYTVVVSNIAGSVTSGAGILAPMGGLVALYTFQEGSGTVVRDLSGRGAPLDLEISDAGAVTWIPDGGISLDASALIASSDAASKIIDACELSNALTVEAWVRAANITQSGPARIATLSADTGNRNFTLGQDLDAWAMRIRTPVTGVNGSNPQFLTQAGLVDTSMMQHVVFTRDQGGEEVMYLNGQEMDRRNVGGVFSNWNANYRFALGNELTGDRPWLGELHRVAVYSAALTAEEVEDSFEAGADAPPPAPSAQSPVLANVIRTATEFSFQFSTVSGANYAVEYKDDLGQPNWTELNTVQGDGNIHNVMDSDLLASARYYRVRLE